MNNKSDLELELGKWMVAKWVHYHRNPSKDYGHNDKAGSPWLKWGK